MCVFDLLFILLVLGSLVTWITAACFAFRRDFRRARRLALRFLASAAVYIAVVIIVSLVLPRRALGIGESQCFDDWCITVADYKRSPEGAGNRYKLDLRLSSRAHRVSQRENNLAVYLTDANGRRYNPVAAGSTGELSVRLRPQESVLVSRSFLTPAEASGIGAVITHEGGFPIGWFIVGYDTWFRKPPVVVLR